MQNSGIDTERLLTLSLLKAKLICLRDHNAPYLSPAI
jgi:hypothetical protein